MENLNNYNCDSNFERIICPKVLPSPNIMFWLIKVYYLIDKMFRKMNDEKVFSLQVMDF